MGQLARAEFAQRFGGQLLRARAQPDPDHQLLAVFRVGYTDDLSVQDVGVGVEELLDFPRVDVLAAADHHVLDPPGDGQVPVGIHHGEVAGVHPVGRVDGLGGLVRLVPVADHHRVAAGAQLARSAARHGAARLGVDDLHLEVRPDPAHGGYPAVERVVGAGLGGDRRGLRHAVADPYLGHPHLPDDLLHHLDRAGRARHDAGTQAGQVVRGEARGGQLGDEHGGHPVERGAALGLHGLQRRDRVEGRRGDDHAGPVAGRGQVAHHHAEAVVERHRDADPVRLGVVAQLADEEAVVQDVVVRQRRALRETRGTRGVLDVDGVVGVQLDGVERPAVQAAAGVEQRLPLRAAEQYDGIQFRAARPDLGDHRGVVGGLEPHRRDEQRGA